MTAQPTSDLKIKRGLAIVTMRVRPQSNVALKWGLSSDVRVRASGEGRQICLTPSLLYHTGVW
jgi:hypothetical protein